MTTYWWLKWTDPPEAYYLFHSTSFSLGFYQQCTFVLWLTEYILTFSDNFRWDLLISTCEVFCIQEQNSPDFWYWTNLVSTMSLSRIAVISCFITQCHGDCHQLTRLILLYYQDRHLSAWAVSQLYCITSLKQYHAVT